MDKFSESILRKLRKIALNRKRPLQEILRYYAMERFLYRLSLSPYKKRFFLKGGLMLMVWDPGKHRATVDIDFLARTNNSIANISRILKEICLQPVVKDGVDFDPKELALEESQLGMEYRGVSARFSVFLHRVLIPLRIDIGFSDQIFPQPAEIKYPTLLHFPAPELEGYTPETTIAEKLDAMIKLGLANSRMKDFYDIWTLLHQFQIKPEKIASVIERVFQNRKTTIRTFPRAFSEAFYKAPRNLERWKAFLKGIKHVPISFEEVIIEIRNYFLPIFEDRMNRSR